MHLRSFLLAGVVALVGLGGFLLLQTTTVTEQGFKVGHVPIAAAACHESDCMPVFRATTVDGAELSDESLRGKTVLINFWATWCPPCRVEMPTLQTIYSEYKGKGLEILAVNIEPDSNQEIREFMKELRLTFPVLLDPDLKVARNYRVFGVPVSMLIDHQGIIRARDFGYRDWTDKESRKQLESLLK